MLTPKLFLPTDALWMRRKQDWQTADEEFRKFDTSVSGQVCAELASEFWGWGGGQRPRPGQARTMMGAYVFSDQAQSLFCKGDRMTPKWTL